MAILLTEPTAHVLIEIDGELAFLTLNRPDKRNALSFALMRELTSALRKVGENTGIKVGILKANGSVFSAGHDLTELVDRGLDTYREIFDACVGLMETIQSIPQPIIAQVQGPATAAGCQLVAACDLAVASDQAWFATPGVKIGLFCSTPMVAVSRAVSRKKMMEMLLTGDPISAQEALAEGLINRAVPPSSLESATRELADKICAMSPYVVGLGKRAFYEQLEMTEHKAYEYTKEVMSLNAKCGDAHEGITAFLEKRKPKWSNR